MIDPKIGTPAPVLGAGPPLVPALGGAGPITVQPTLADGLAGNLEPGTVTVDLTRQLVADIVTVSEDEIADAIDLLFREHGLVVEGSGAVGVAALLHGRVAVIGPTAVVVTGRNIARDVFVRVLNREGGGPRRR